MSRSGYTDDGCGEEWSMICYRGAVLSALRGKRGQAFFIELRDALDAMPEKVLIEGTLEAEGQFCTLGVIGAKRGVELKRWDGDAADIAPVLNIAAAMAREIVYENDEHPGEWERLPDGSGRWVQETPEHRWTRMRKWVDDQIIKEAPSAH